MVPASLVANPSREKKKTAHVATHNYTVLILIHPLQE